MPIFPKCHFLTVLFEKCVLL